MKKSDRFGMECELAGAEQMIFMIKKQLRNKVTNRKLIRKWLKELRSNIAFVEFTLRNTKEADSIL